jgi:hypothetical protein
MSQDPVDLIRQLVDAHGTVADLVPGQDAFVLVRMSTIADIVAALSRLIEEDNDGPV